MATVCTNCGHDLPRDDAHFCTHCGTLVPSHPFSAQSLSTANTSNPLVREEAEKSIVPEQMAHRQTEKPALREQRVQQPRQRTTRRIGPDDSTSSPVSWPAPITHVSVKETSAQKEREQIVSSEQTPAQTISARVTPPELHVKVWDENNPPTPLPESRVEPGQRTIEDAPTSPIEMPVQLEKEQVSVNESDASWNGVEYIDTTPMPNYAPAQLTHQSQQIAHSPRSTNDNTPVPTFTVESQQQRQQNYANAPISDASVQRRKAAIMSSTQERHVPVAATPGLSRRRKSPVPFIILLALLGILVLGGGAWVLLAQPFSVSSVTQPLQDFSDTGLGITLSYPNSWTVQHTANSVLFADSSHTGQVRVQVAHAASDAATYVQQQAQKSGMTAIKPLGTTSFAGLSWQQVQGSIQQDGANYTTTMLATTHGNRVYLLTQMAPQNVYSDEESVVFSAMRHSFKFL